MLFALRTALQALALFAGMLALMELGVRLGRRRMERDPAGARAGTAAAEGAVFALLGLMIAFTFSGALQRFETRRQLIVEEAQAIGTAYARVDLLSSPAREQLQQGFRDYLDARLSVYEAAENSPALSAALARTNELQGTLWSGASAACRDAGQAATLLLLPALNAMFDVALARIAATENHPPSLVFYLLILLALACALLAGFALAQSELTQWMYRLAFAGVVCFTVYAIQDLEYPRHGFVRVDRFDHLLVEVRASMNASTK